MRHTMESDLRILKAEGCSVLSYIKTQNGHAILWFDAKGYTVTVRGPGGNSMGITRLLFKDAKAEYMQEILELL